MNNWICPKEYVNLKPINLYMRQKEMNSEIISEMPSLHILYRKVFELENIRVTNISITADDYYMLFVNGKFVVRGPVNNYHFIYNVNSVDITPFLRKWEKIKYINILVKNSMTMVQ